jgi:hypothetical protein
MGDVAASKQNAKGSIIPAFTRIQATHQRFSLTDTAENGQNNPLDISPTFKPCQTFAISG